TPPPATALGPAFLARQTVVARHQQHTARFDAVLQYDGETLLLLGLTPMGTKSFALRQRGASTELERFVDIPLPAPAEAILLDIHRAYFDDRPTQIRPDGWHRRRGSDASGRTVQIHERWAAGRLHERIWGPRRSARSQRVRWPDGLAPSAIPKRVELDHPELDLQLEIHTLDFRAL
ncbi:MAG: DUF3261 domain-containing protein, partial [Deltaproteobacteria bacterium]|nr:DUF3261 domain-containing protein [Nannocystaceae bacterium]